MFASYPIDFDIDDFLSRFLLFSDPKIITFHSSLDQNQVKIEMFEKSQELFIASLNHLLTKGYIKGVTNEQLKELPYYIPLWVCAWFHIGPWVGSQFVGVCFPLLVSEK